ncbi:Formamidopyrimidine-DNA glycosylase [compost metagenome]
MYKRVVNKPITAVRVNREKTINIAADLFISSLVGKHVIEMERRAKYLIFHMSSGQFLLLHLMLGGFMHLGNEADRPERSTQVEIDFGPETLYFMGLRLGFLHLLDESQVQEKLEELGPEPLSGEYTLSQFLASLKDKKSSLKTLLPNQQWLAGIGNSYSDEICFDVGIVPMRKINECSKSELSDLFHSIQTVLLDAVRKGGYMEVPLYAGDKLTGGYNPHFRVYDRGGEPCVRCEAPLKKIELASRKCFYCTNCQH